MGPVFFISKYSFKVFPRAVSSFRSKFKILSFPIEPVTRYTIDRSSAAGVIISTIVHLRTLVHHSSAKMQVSTRSTSVDSAREERNDLPSSSLASLASANLNTNLKMTGPNVICLMIVLWFLFATSRGGSRQKFFAGVTSQEACV